MIAGACFSAEKLSGLVVEYPFSTDTETARAIACGHLGKHATRPDLCLVDPVFELGPAQCQRFRIDIKWLQSAIDSLRSSFLRHAIQSIPLRPRHILIVEILDPDQGHNLGVFAFEHAPFSKQAVFVDDRNSCRYLLRARRLLVLEALPQLGIG